MKTKFITQAKLFLRIVASGVACIAFSAPGSASAPSRTFPGPISNNPALACETLVRIDPTQIPSRYRWDTYWSLAVNFKAFVKDDPRRPYACLKLYGLDYSTGKYVNLAPNASGIPIEGCTVVGKIEMSSRQLSGLQTVVGVADFSGNNSYIACDLNLRNTVNVLAQAGRINRLPNGALPELDLFYTYDAFAYAAVATVKRSSAIVFASYVPGTNCVADARKQSIMTRCGDKSYAMDQLRSGQLEQRTTTDGQDVRTRGVLWNSHGYGADFCWVNTARIREPLIWSSYLGALAGYSPDQHHAVLDITNTNYRLVCNAGGAVPSTLFYTGQSTLYIGGAPNRTSDWGELYELTADPGGSSSGTDGVR